VEDNLKSYTYRITKFYHYRNKIKHLSNVEVNVCNLENNKTILTFFDTILPGNNKFKRFIDYYNQEYYYQDNKLIVKIIEKKTAILTPIKLANIIENNLITLDLETMNIKGRLIPFCASFYDGLNKYSFYLTDYKDSEEMLINLIESLLKRKYSGYNVYVHNLSDFDAIFFFKILATFKSTKFATKLTPIYNKETGNMINLKLNYSSIDNKKTFKYNINFRDSLLMLPESLDELANNFNLERKKSIYPYNFVNDKFNTNTMHNIIKNYIGPVPSLNYFPDHVDTKEFIKYLLSFNND
jgi:DNA polymerase type B, organellar and viral